MFPAVSVHLFLCRERGRFEVKRVVTRVSDDVDILGRILPRQAGEISLVEDGATLVLAVDLEAGSGWTLSGRADFVVPDQIPDDEWGIWEQILPTPFWQTTCD